MFYWECIVVMCFYKVYVCIVESVVVFFEIFGIVYIYNNNCKVNG